MLSATIISTSSVVTSLNGVEVSITPHNSTSTEETNIGEASPSHSSVFLGSSITEHAVERLENELEKERQEKEKERQEKEMLRKENERLRKALAGK
jgi:cell shape-determining protein MreC